MPTIYTLHHAVTIPTESYPSALYTGGRLKAMYDTVTIAVAAGQAEALTIVFPRLLPGRVIVISPLIWVRGDDADANADLHLGHLAYTNSALATIAASTNLWLDNVDIGGGNIQGLVPAITGVTTAGARPIEFDAQDGLQLTLMVDTADANVNDVYTLFVPYIHID